jgi:peptidyl-prolyl cis-trans isomerase C
MARVNGEAVSLGDLLDTAEEVMPPQMRNFPRPMFLQIAPPDVVAQVLERTITERALTQAARAAGMESDPAIQRRIRRAGDQELQQALLARDVNAAITEDALRARFARDTAGRQGEEEVRARHILVATETTARQVLAEVNRAGVDFAEVAKRRSTDPGARDGGDLGFFKRGDMVPEFAQAAFALQPGQISPTPVRSPFGWHIIKVEERRSAPSASFEETRAQLRQSMLEEQLEIVVRRVVGAAVVERLDQPPTAPAGSLLQGAQPPARR